MNNELLEEIYQAIANNTDDKEITDNESGEIFVVYRADDGETVVRSIDKNKDDVYQHIVYFIDDNEDVLVQRRAKIKHETGEVSGEEIFAEITDFHRNEPFDFVDITDVDDEDE